MSSTNKTANYELSQYIGSDKPTYLVDYNGDMLKIDTGMAANKAQADATDLVVSGHTSAISGLQDTVSNQGTAITGLRTDVDGNTGSINTINSLIGNGEPTTVDKTIIGAINEIDEKTGDVSSLTTTVKTSLVGAVNEINTRWRETMLHGAVASVVADGVKSYNELLKELAQAFITYSQYFNADRRFTIEALRIEGLGDYLAEVEVAYNSQQAGINFRFNKTQCFASEVDVASIVMSSGNDSSFYGAIINATPAVNIYSNTNIAPADGVHIYLIGSEEIRTA